MVPGHMAYRTAMPKLLREAGWLVESDEFVEIEDPDPENHEKRQRELINEIEQARRELEKKNAEKEKRGSKLGWWRKKKGDKKDWELYDKNSQAHAPIDKTADTATLAENPVMFDIDAIRREVAALAAESADKPYNGYEEAALEIKEIKSTLPPMKISLPAAGTSTAPSLAPLPTLRQTQSFNDSLGAPGGKANKALSTGALTPGVRLPPGSQLSNGTTGTKHYDEYDAYDEYDEFDDGAPSMTFDTSFRSPTTTTAGAAHKSPPSAFDSPAPSNSAWDSPNPGTGLQRNGTWDSPPAATVVKTDVSWDAQANDVHGRPPLRSATTLPAANPGYNAWADEDEFGGEKDMRAVRSVLPKTCWRP